MLSPLSLPPLSLYIHVPWCIRKCPYCDFNSHAKGPDGIPEGQYIEALLKDFQLELPKVQGRELQTIFIGGGTPSLLSPQGYQRLFDGLKGMIPFSREIEITLEANPGTYEHGRFQGYFDAGVNRLSLGVQSFQNNKLKALGRIHSAEEAVEAISSLQQENNSQVNFNIDLMHGLPDQSRDDALNDLKMAISLKPTHISWYQLTIEPNTVFYSKPPAIPEDDILWSIQESGQQLLADSGYRQYEISAYSLPGKHARHNLNYWQFGDYIGIGAGAHGKWTCARTGDISRNWKTRMPQDYLSAGKAFQAGLRTLEASEIPLEFMMNALRLYHGVDASLYEKRTGQPLSSINKGLSEAVQKGLMVKEKRLAPTEQGRLFLNDLLELFA